MEQKYRTGGARFWAAIIDGLVFMPPVIVERHLILPTDNKIGFILWQIFCITFACSYSVILHARFGQTLGKMVMKVKLVDFSEAVPITLKQAVMRDIVGIVVNCIALVYLIISLQNMELITDHYDDFMGPWPLFWLLLELVTMLSNSKRRAIHDFIAGTVVVKTDK